MVITITCNPAIDKTITSDDVIFDIGGKGINVAKTLNILNCPCIATGFVGKQNKDLVIDDLNKLGIENHFIEIDGKVRTNVKRIINGNLVEENEDGPYINEEAINELLLYLNNFKNEIVVISGSVSYNTDKKIYKRIIEKCKENNNYVILDASNDLLRYGIEAKPDVIKPNKKEVEKLFDMPYDEKTIIEKCKALGIDLICVSLGEEGALFIGKETYKCEALKVEINSSVGAGDAMVAGLAYSKDKNMNIVDCIKLCTALAASTCQTKGTKPPNYVDVIKKIDDVIIKKYDC